MGSQRWDQNGALGSGVGVGGGTREADDGFETEDIGGSADANMKSTKGGVSDAVTARHSAFLERCSGKVEQNQWRKKHLHRQASRRWLDNIDNQLKIMFHDKGLSFFQWKPDDEDMYHTCAYL